MRALYALVLLLPAFWHSACSIWHQGRATILHRRAGLHIQKAKRHEAFMRLTRMRLKWRR